MSGKGGSSEGRRAGRVLAALSAALLLAGAGCASSGGAKKPDKITQELLSTPKETLFAKGKALIEKKKWEDGRKYLSYVFETYPNDPLGRDALLMVADSYVKQGGTASYTEARYRYRDYLNRYPDAPRRDYARYQFAYCSDKEHGTADRDQTSTREAIQQYQALIREFPDSAFAGAGRERIRQLVDLLAEHEFGVGYFYMRKGSLASAMGRFSGLEERFPDYGAKDKLYFYEARTLTRLGRNEEASRYYSRLLEEYPKSLYVKKAKDQLKKLKPTGAPAEEKEARKPPESQPSKN
ncbi:MAG TPA: outer membrane protein assembly factor BamD [Thermoanaerobaculia bacterium]|nr:outer membrane protein assembly factor BamD [Thermoanaerobaculia bacterium]